MNECIYICIDEIAKDEENEIGKFCLGKCNAEYSIVYTLQRH